ncbi:MAG: polysaccharide biosynthesis C-terminal domain-containing protein [Bacillota bacterium]
MLILYLSSYLLSPSEFGMFSLFLIILNFVYLFVGFGVTDTAMYVISKNNSKGLYGALLILSIIISILFSIILSIVLYYYDFENSILIGIVSSGFILNLFVKKVSIGMNEKFAMYYFELFVYFISFLLILSFSDDVYESMFFYSIGMFIVSILFIIRVRPEFSDFSKNIKFIFKNIKEYGAKVHFSQFIAMGTYDLDKIMLKYYMGFTSVGIYNLALTFIMPVKLFSMSISEMLFKDFTKHDRIKKEIFIMNIIVSLIFSIILSIIGYYLIIFFYEEAYYEILDYIYLLPILAVLSSLYVPINNFFSAKGLAKQKLINAVVLAICNVLFNLVLVPRFGVIGAIYATIFSLTVNNVLFIYQYKLYIKR